MHGPEPLVYTVEELIQESKIGRTLIYREIKAGRLRVTKLARRTLIPVEEAKRWILEAMPPVKD